MSVNQRWQIAAIVLAIGIVLYLLGPMLTPFATAAMFAYLFDPLADRLEKAGLGRSMAVSIVFAGMLLVLTLILLFLVPFLENQISYLINILPTWLEKLRNDGLPWLQKHFGLAPDFLEAKQLIAMLEENWRAAGGVAATIVAQVSKSGLAIIGWIMNLLLIPVVTFYLLRDWDILMGRIHEILPRSVAPTIKQLAAESNSVLSAFVRGQILVMLAMGAIYAIGLAIIGIDVGPLIGIFAGLISFVPYLGTILGVVAALIAAFLQHHDWPHLVMVLGVFVIGNMVEGYVLIPRLVGTKIGLHPVAVIFAILAGGQLFGFLGVLLALPMASVVMVLLRYGHERYRESELYQTEQSTIEVVNMVSPDLTTEMIASKAAPIATAIQSPHPQTVPTVDTSKIS